MKSGATRAWLLMLGLAVAGCGETAQAPDEAQQSGAPAGPELRPVVEAAITALERSVEIPEPAVEDEETGIHVDGLLSMFGSHEGGAARFSVVAGEELRGLGAQAVPSLRRVLFDRRSSGPRRDVAVMVLGEQDERGSAEILLSYLETSRGDQDPEPRWLHACAHALGETSQDWVVPRLVLCLRYEKDHDTVVSIAATLAHFGNYSGLEALRVLTRTGSGTVQSRAHRTLERLAREADLPDAAALAHAWSSGEGLPAVSVSPARELEVWKTILALSEWQLRGVDDGRFVLSRLGPHASGLLAAALVDEDLYIRVHSAQCLERMGPRAAAAGVALARGLEDPALAPQAAAALGGLGQAEACAPLIARLAAVHPLELRVAAARALGALDCTEADAPLSALLGSDEAVDLRAAAAGCLVRSGPLSEAAPAVHLLAGLLTSGEVEPTVIEADLEVWLARGGPERAAEEVREAWHAAGALPQAERLERRAELILQAQPEE